MVITIRRAEIVDIGGIISLLHQVSKLHLEYRPDICNGGLNSPEEYEAQLNKENYPAFVAIGDTDHVLGCCLCEIIRYTEAKFMAERTLLYIHDFGVDESYRKQGIGTNLLTAAKEYALSIGAYDVELGVWEFNKNAIGFYEHCGFVTQRRRMELFL